MAVSARGLTPAQSGTVVACSWWSVLGMHNGFHVLEVDDDGTAQPTHRVDTLGELAYGADWHPASESDWAASCTFYNHAMQLWQVIDTC